MPAQLEVVAIFKPNPGKTERAQQVLAEMAAYVQANEPGVLRYHLQRETKGDEPTFVLFERYQDKEAMKAHATSPRFKEFSRTLAEEKLFAIFQVVYSKGAGGFESRL